VVLAGEPSTEMKAIAEDIDGAATICTSSPATFEYGASHGAAASWWTSRRCRRMRPRPMSGSRRAALLGVRRADEIIALRTERRGAREVVTHLRLRETATVINGFEETVVQKIRVIEPGLWQLWHEVKNAAGETEWADRDPRA
jgi:hypothetical protein